MDDTHTMFISIYGGRARGATYLSVKLESGGAVIPGAEPLDYLPNTTDWFGRWRLIQNLSNDWEIDREVQRSNKKSTFIQETSPEITCRGLPFSP
jgi:phthalate 4,5-dioxygenase